MEQILLAYGLFKETVTTIMMLYRKRESKGSLRPTHIVCWCSAWGYISTITVNDLPRKSTSNVDRYYKKCHYTRKARSRRYPAETIMDAENADNTALLANTPTQAESLLHSLAQVLGSIGPRVNTYKTEYMCFNQYGAYTRNIHCKWWFSEISRKVQLPR